MISAANPSEQRSELGLGDAAVEAASAFAAASHNHDSSYAALSHTHAGTEVSLSALNWTGPLMGSGVKDCQELADWIDANVAVG